MTSGEILSTTPRLVPPSPTRPRFQPLRAGLCNIWEYDDQELWFHDGRLILRGANEAGKSKALELLMPFLLDADLRPQRLDPFGEKSKDMFWNLVGFDAEKTSAIGYCWMEFGRVDDNGSPSYVTIGAGLRATRNGGLGKPWYFVTRRRVREDFSLLDGRTPLTQDKLEAALDREGEVYAVARDYRQAVDRALFDLGTDRYAALIHLLLQLRRPHLSDKLDPQTLSTVLTESLPPLEEARIGQLAGAFDSLDSEAEALASLEGARDAVLAFRDEYRQYARLQTRRRAAELRSAVTRFDAVTRRVRQAEQDRDAALEASRLLEEEKADKRSQEAALDGTLKGLEESDEMREARRLGELKHLARLAQVAAEKVKGQRDETKGDLSRAEERFAKTVRALEAADAQRAPALERAARAARAAGMATIHAVHDQAMMAEPEGTREAIDRAIEETIAAIGLLEAKAHRVKEQEAKLSELRRTASDVSSRRDRTDANLRATAKSCEQEEAQLELEIQGWTEGLAGIALSPEVIGRLFDDALTRIAEGKNSGRLGQIVLAPYLAELERAAQAFAIKHSRLQTRRQELTEERERVASESDDGPSPRAGRAPDRASRPGAALWQLCDFVDDLPATSRASMEAALEAAGLLDAFVTADGRLIERDNLDTVLAATGEAIAGPTLADVLVPTATLEVSAETIVKLLRQIALAETDEEPEAWAWVSVTGHWRLGPVRGRWAKETAENIGAATRAAARARRLARLDEELNDVTTAIALLEEQIALNQRQRSDLDRSTRTFPDGSALLRLRAALEMLGKQLKELRDELDRLERDILERSEHLQKLVAELRRAASETNLLEALDDLPGRRAALASYRVDLSDCTAACRQALEMRDRQQDALEIRDDLQDRIERLAEELAEAARVAKSRAAEAAAYEEKFGSTVGDVLARRDRAADELKAVRVRIEAIGKELIQEGNTLGAANTKLSQANVDRQEKEAERTAAIGQVAYLAGTELLALAVPEIVASIDPPPWSVKAAVELARRIETQTASVATDEQSADRAENKTFQAFNALRATLGGDFDPALSRDRDLVVVTVRHNARVHGVGALADLLGEEVRKRRELLERDERAVIERHLLGDVGLHLQDRLAAARRLIDAMNEQLASHPTNSGITVRLRWDSGPDTDKKAEKAGSAPGTNSEDITQALKLLRRDVRLLVDADQEALVRFLRARITEARHAEGTGSSADRMARALDYRKWHHFKVVMLQGGSERVMTRKEKGTGSGGSKAVLVHLPLFAAASAHYRSARPEAPHLIMLDEAFDGVDRGQRGSCMGLLAQFDLDFLITNYEEWGCYEELPGVAAYHLSRSPGQPGVAALRFVWDGHTRREDDPFLAAQLAGVI
jgi:uncharacterized protein (TIGR02680 family)